MVDLTLYIKGPVKEEMKEKIEKLCKRLSETVLLLSGYDIPGNSAQAYTGFDVGRFMDEKDCEAFLNIGKQLYELIHPVYGYVESEGFFFNDNPPLPDNKAIEEIFQLKVNYIYWANFFGPKFVEKIGREKILSAPSWKTEELKDGGILLVLGKLAQYSNRIPREEVEKYLGFR